MSEVFTNRMSGASFAEQNGPITIKKNKEGNCFFVSSRANCIAPQGYVSKAAMEQLTEAVSNGMKLKDAISLLQFAVTHYEDSEGNMQELPTLMPQASGEVLFTSTEEDWLSSCKWSPNGDCLPL